MYLLKIEQAAENFVEQNKELCTALANNDYDGREAEFNAASERYEQLATQAVKQLGTMYDDDGDVVEQDDLQSDFDYYVQQAL